MYSIYYPLGYIRKVLVYILSVYKKRGETPAKNCKVKSGVLKDCIDLFKDVQDDVEHRKPIQLNTI